MKLKSLIAAASLCIAVPAFAATAPASQPQPAPAAHAQKAVLTAAEAKPSAHDGCAKEAKGKHLKGKEKEDFLASCRAKA